MDAGRRHALGRDLKGWIGLFPMVLLLQLNVHAALGQPAIEVAAGLHNKAAFLSPAPNGSTSLLLMSRSDPLIDSAQPPLLELLSVDASGSLLKRQRLDQSLANAVLPRTPSCDAKAVASKDGGFIVLAPKAYENGPLTTMASVFRLSPDGSVLQKLDLGHPGFAAPAWRQRTDVTLCLSTALPGTDGTLLVVGEYVEMLGAGDRHPWWALFDPAGQTLAESDGEDAQGAIVAVKVGPDGTIWTVRSVWAEHAGRLHESRAILRGRPPSGAGPKPVVLFEGEFMSRALFTENEIVIVSISNRWTTNGECSFPIGFFSRDGRRLRSALYPPIARKCDAAPGDGMPEGLIADGEGLLAQDNQGRIARFDRLGRMVWRSSAADLLAFARREDGTLVALERTPAGLALRHYP